MKKPLISLTTDLGLGEEVAMMKAVILGINEDSLILDLRHDVPPFNIIEGAWTLESVAFLPIGFHVCVIDPGVGTSRKAIAIKTKRGDYLIGPDNGVLLPAARRLGGIEKVVEITNEKYMRTPVCHVFHGRDIFAPIAAWLSKGVRLEDLGEEIDPKNLVKPPYEEARVSKHLIEGKIIHINRFGSVHLNVLQGDFEKTGIGYGDEIVIELPRKKKRIKAKFFKTFGDVGVGKVVVFNDDYGRVEIAINQGNLCRKFDIKLLDVIRIRKV